MPDTPIESFWNAYLQTLSHGMDLSSLTYTAWSFGNTQDLADELGELVRQGVKTATCSLLWEYEADGEKLPQTGDLSIILDGEGKPLCIIRTIEVEIKPFNQVAAQFAYEEGEGDRSLDYWRKAHRYYFSGICSRLGREVAETMPLVCERFQLAYPLDK